MSEIIQAQNLRLSRPQAQQSNIKEGSPPLVDSAMDNQQPEVMEEVEEISHPPSLSHHHLPGATPAPSVETPRTRRKNATSTQRIQVYLLTQFSVCWLFAKYHSFACVAN